MKDLGIDHGCRRRHTDARLAVEARMPMRDDRVRQELEITLVACPDRLYLSGVVCVHRMDLRGRLSGYVRLRSVTEVHVQRQTVPLQHAPRRRDDEHARQLRHAFVPVQRPLHQVRHATVQPRQDAAVVAAFETEVQISGLANGTARHLRRFIPIRRELRRMQPEACITACGNGCQQRRCDWRIQAASLSLRSNRMSCRIRLTSSAMPSPVRQLVNTNGLPPRIRRESCSITSRLAPT